MVMNSIAAIILLVFSVEISFAVLISANFAYHKAPLSSFGERIDERIAESDKRWVQILWRIRWPVIVFLLFLVLCADIFLASDRYGELRKLLGYTVFGFVVDLPGFMRSFDAISLYSRFFSVPVIALISDFFARRYNRTSVFSANILSDDYNDTEINFRRILRGLIYGMPIALALGLIFDINILNVYAALSTYAASENHWYILPVIYPLIFLIAAIIIIGEVKMIRSMWKIIRNLIENSKVIFIVAFIGLIVYSLFFDGKGNSGVLAVLTVVLIIAFNAVKDEFGAIERAYEEYDRVPQNHSFAYYVWWSLLLPAYGLTWGTILAVSKNEEYVKNTRRNKAALWCLILGGINIVVLFAAIFILLKLLVL